MNCPEPTSDNLSAKETHNSGGSRDGLDPPVRGGPSPLRSRAIGTREDCTNGEHLWEMAEEESPCALDRLDAIPSQSERAVARGSRRGFCTEFTDRIDFATT